MAPLIVMKQILLACLFSALSAGCEDLVPGKSDTDPNALSLFGSENSKHLDGTLHIVEFKGHKFAIWSGDTGSAIIEIHDAQQ